MKNIPKAEIINRLNKIYDLIPSFDCKHCQKCSAPIMWFKPEEINIKEFIKKQELEYITWSDEEFKTNKMKCPYLQHNRCTIYPVRPMVCRLQGTITQLICPNNPHPLLTKKHYQRIIHKLNELNKMIGGIDDFYGTRKNLNQNHYMKKKI